jgi:hypothetical protein
LVNFLRLGIQIVHGSPPDLLYPTNGEWSSVQREGFGIT